MRTNLHKLNKSTKDPNSSVYTFSYFFLLLGGKKDPENDYFDDIGTCIVKTSAMFVGELEFGDIPFRNKIKIIFALKKKSAPQFCPPSV